MNASAVVGTVYEIATCHQLLRDRAEAGSYVDVGLVNCSGMICSHSRRPLLSHGGGGPSQRAFPGDLVCEEL